MYVILLRIEMFFSYLPSRNAVEECEEKAEAEKRGIRARTGIGSGGCILLATGGDRG